MACATVPRMATMKAAIIVFEWPGSRPCSAPSRIALGMNSQALVVPCASRVAKGVIGFPSQVFGDRFELTDGFVRALRAVANRLFKAVIDVVVHQRLLGVADGAFYGLQLLGDVQAFAAVLKHADDTSEVPLGALQTLDDFRMGSVCAHATYPIPQDRIRQV
ncbi:conserved hypothetical protein [Candidatus Accumulibacter aalborgensis]|uniref:Uncharacterized protein n=1 Tax=Candidatus Accumulibacter aalborgensis TaxID=1860102 RepID=A0A1A8XYA0_9PROT|nr:conserved hypothetical protein [Candidatus Accumulibacter aalborgensis]